MFRNKSGDITDINLLEINNTIKGGFPKIKICDTEITKKILEKKPREFSNNKIISIKDMLKMKKKTESSLNLLSDPQMINSLQYSFASNNEIMNIIKDTNDEINGISIDLIIGRSKINNKELSDRLEKSKSSKSKSSKSKSSKSKSSKSKSSKSKKSKN
jgi:hypothetical protein